MRFAYLNALQPIGLKSNCWDYVWYQTKLWSETLVSARSLVWGSLRLKLSVTLLFALIRSQTGFLVSDQGLTLVSAKDKVTHYALGITNGLALSLSGFRALNEVHSIVWFHSFRRWSVPVSEQLLNGTSAHVRPFSVSTCDFSMEAVCRSHIGLMSIPCSLSRSPWRKNSCMMRSVHCR